MPETTAVVAPVWATPNPFGKAVKLKVYGATPPETVQVLLYATPTVVGPVVGLHTKLTGETAAAIVPLKVTLACCNGLEPSRPKTV